jgi:AcrR family transcriptional regulator
MEEKSPREVKGRRSRPAKAPLNRALIVTTALSILEKEGLSGLSLRRVAAALDTGAASLYVYLANLDELHALMLDQALAAVSQVAGRGSSWRDRLKSYLVSYLHVLDESPGLAHLAMSTIATGPNSLRMWEVLLGLLKEGGIAETALVAGADLLLLHVTAIAAEEAAQREFRGERERVPNALAAASREQFPLVADLFEQGMFSAGGDDDARVRWALDVAIDGITANQIPSYLDQPLKAAP